MNKQDFTDHSRRLAQAALALDTPLPAVGRAPDETELHAWASGKLSAEEAEQLTLQALQDPQLMQRFRDARAAVELDSSSLLSAVPTLKERLEDYVFAVSNSVASQLKSITKFGWSTSAAAGGLVTASLITLVFLFQSTNSNPPLTESWDSSSIIKSSFDGSNVMTPGDENIALLSGIQSIRPDLVSIKVSPQHKVVFAECASTGAGCDEPLATLASVGKLAATTDLTCRTSADINTMELADTGREQLHRALNRLHQHPSTHRYHALLERWRDSTTTQRYCASAAEIVERAIRTASAS